MQMLGLSYTWLDFWDGLMDWRAELMEEGGGSSSWMEIFVMRNHEVKG